MSKFTINKELFAKFLGLCELGINKELAINVSSGSISGSVHFNKNIIINASIPGKYEDWGEVGVDFLPPLVKLLGSSTSKPDISLSKSENQLICECDNIEYTVDLRAPQYIVNKPDAGKVAGFMESLKNCPNFTLTPKDTLEILQYGQAVGAKSILFTGKDTKLVAQVKGPKESCKITLSLKDIKEPFKVSFGDLFFKVLSAIKEYNITITLNVASKLAHIKIDSKEVNFECLLIGIL